MSLEIAIVYGSMRRERAGIRVVRFLEQQLRARHHQPHVIDAMEEGLPLLDLRLSDYGEGEAPAGLVRLSERIKAADGFILVSGEYNHTLQPGLTNLIDHFYAEWGHRPAGLATYSTGGFGGVRAAAHLRNIASAVGMITMPSGYTQPGLNNALDEQGNPSGEGPEKFAKPMLDQLVWYAEAIKAKRQTDGLPGQ